MKGFVQGADRQQTTLLPECLDDWVDESNPVRAVDVFVDAPDLRDLGFDSVDPAATGRPAYHPSPMLKLYIYGYVNRVQSSRRLECEAGRNLEVTWLTGRLVPDHKTIADFRKDNGPAIKKVCVQCPVPPNSLVLTETQPRMGDLAVPLGAATQCGQDSSAVTAIILRAWLRMGTSVPI
jgi:transposase